MAREPQTRPQQTATPLASPLQKRSQYLAQALAEMSKEPQRIAGYGDLGARLLAQAITQAASEKTDQALSAQASNAELQRRRAQFDGKYEIPGEMQEVGSGRLGNPIAPILRAGRNLFSGGDAPQPAPAASNAAPMPPASQFNAPMAPVPLVENGGPLPPISMMGQEPPQAMAQDPRLGPAPAQSAAMPQQQASPTPMPMAPQADANPLAMTPQEDAFIRRALASGDPGLMDQAAELYADIQTRGIGPAALRNEIVDINGVKFAVDPVTRQTTQIFPDGVPQAARTTVFRAGQDNPYGVAPGTLLNVSPEGVVSVVDRPPAGMARVDGRITNEPGFVDAQSERDRAAAGLERDVKLEQERPQFEARLDRIGATTNIVVSEIDFAREIVQNNPGVLGLVGTVAATIPGTPAYDLAQSIKTIQGNLGFEYLQDMRNSNPTGGGVGALTERELDIMSSTSGSLAQGQSEARFLRSLDQVEGTVQRGNTRARTLYDTTYRRPAPQAQPRNQQAQRPAAQPRQGTAAPPRPNGQVRRWNPNTQQLEPVR